MLWNTREDGAAESEYTKFRMEVEDGEHLVKMTFRAFVEEWRSEYAIKHLAFKTLTGYDSNLESRISTYSD